VRGAAGKLRSEMRAAATETRQARGSAKEPGDWEGAFGDPESWRAAKEELRKAKQEWKEQARRAKDESRRAREDAQQARRQAKEAQETAREEMQRIAKQVQDQVQMHFTRGDWPTGVREGLSELSTQLGGLARGTVWPPYLKPEPAGEDPEWAKDTMESGDPARDLDRLLDRFRDDIRDAARDHGVTEQQLGEVRRHLSTVAAHIGALLRGPKP
jgi:hypothetical protein